MNIQLETVVPTKKQVIYLYNQLNLRAYAISHEQIPSYTTHKEFVENNPYRAWFIIQIDGKSSGDVYVQTDNSVGLNNVEDLDVAIIKAVINLIRKRLTPLPAIPSVRYKDFFFNVSVANTKLGDKLVKIGLKPSQITYIQPTK